MTMAAVVTHRHVLIKIIQNLSVVDHVLYIDWLVELFTSEIAYTRFLFTLRS